MYVEEAYSPVTYLCTKEHRKGSAEWSNCAENGRKMWRECESWGLVVPLSSPSLSLAAFLLLDISLRPPTPFLHVTVQVVAVVRSLSCVWLFVTPGTAACQASLSFKLLASVTCNQGILTSSRSGSRRGCQHGSLSLHSRRSSKEPTWASLFPLVAEEILAEGPLGTAFLHPEGCSMAGMLLRAPRCPCDGDAYKKGGDHSWAAWPSELLPPNPPGTAQLGLSPFLCLRSRHDYFLSLCVLVDQSWQPFLKNLAKSRSPAWEQMFSHCISGLQTSSSWFYISQVSHLLSFAWALISKVSPSSQVLGWVPQE